MVKKYINTTINVSLTLEKVLKLTRRRGQQEGYSLWIIGNGMKEVI